ncbi:MAG: hypothetical protein IT159_04410 [Bryobacterales bacterium]|nr:hypothetical protein [Bryobacterales bacterium]
MPLRLALTVVVSFLMALTSSHMRALRLREVSLRVRRAGKKQAHKRNAEDGGGFADDLVERGIMIVHERSPCPRSPKASCAVRK